MSKVLAHQRLFEPTVSPAHDLNARIFVPAAAAPGASEIRARSFERLEYSLEQASWSAHDMVESLMTGALTMVIEAYTFSFTGERPWRRCLRPRRIAFDRRQRRWSKRCHIGVAKCSLQVEIFD